MALFSKKKKTTAVVKKEIKASQENLAGVLVRPRITEKAARLSEGNAYTFNVSPSANKTQVKKAIEQTYKVSPLKVAIVNQLGRRVFGKNKGGAGKTKGNKKAIVYLKKGDTIEFV